MAIDIESVASRLYDSSKDQVLAELWLNVSHAAGDCAEFCESEIELMLLAAFDCQHHLVGREKFTKVISPGNPVSWETLLGDEAKMLIAPQFKWGKYRIDFMVLLKGFDQQFFIECDGHEFHERTKEQAERDRAKDREIQAAGIPILRFTGREIHRDPFSCVLQIQKFIMGRAQASKVG